MPYAPPTRHVGGYEFSCQGRLGNKAKEIKSWGEGLMIRITPNTKFMEETIDIFAICLPIWDYGRNLPYLGLFIAVTIHFLRFNNLLRVGLTEFLLASFIDMT